MNLTFLVRGKDADVNEAKRRIIASFQTQVNCCSLILLCFSLILIFCKHKLNLRLLIYKFQYQMSVKKCPKKGHKLYPK